MRSVLTEIGAVVGSQLALGIICLVTFAGFALVVGAAFFLASLIF